VETLCSHIFCESCLLAAVLVKPECPLDHVALPRDRIRKAGFVRRMVLDLQVRCPHGGCPFTGTLLELPGHTERCPFAPAACPQCGDLVPARELRQHVAGACPGREVPCEFCGRGVALEDERAHVQRLCASAPLPCPNQCGSPQLPRAALSEHLASQCPLQPVACRYARQGCAARPLRRDIAAHLADAAAHLDCVERHYELELAAARREAAEAVRFAMQVGSVETFVKMLGSVAAPPPAGAEPAGPAGAAIELIVRGMRLFETDAVVGERALFALITLCEAANRHADANIGVVVACGGIGAIVDAMRRHPTALKVQEYALHVLRKMATNTDVKNFVQRGTTDCLAQILAAMERHESVLTLQRDAIGVLLNMAVNDQIEVRIGELGGAAHILRAMDRFPDSASLQQLACHAIFHLTFDDLNKERVIALGALPRLVAAMRAHAAHTFTVYYAIRALAQVGKVERFRDKMRRLGVHSLAQQAIAAHPGHKDLQRKARLLLALFSASPSALGADKAGSSGSAGSAAASAAANAPAAAAAASSAAAAASVGDDAAESERPQDQTSVRDAQ
jgi:hypothetical protein